MKIIADLQVHSRFSRATSGSITLKNLEKYARLKGITLLGTGDFTHPEWLREIKAELREDGSGILESSSGFKFMLQGEISNIFTQDGKGRRIHTLLLAKSFDVVDQINAALLKKGRLDYDGRPIFGFSCIELVEMMKSIDSSIEIIPAHIWTPWFGLLGSNSGFDSVEECFKDRAKHIHAVETGLSSDPKMNWRVSSLDNYTLVSNSDAHSYWPWRLGRECTVFDTRWSYDELIHAIRTRKGMVETIEVDPHYGKYHYDGHRNCGVVLSPEATRKLKGICPTCRQPLTIGVQYRVEQLADREKGYIPKDAASFRKLIPLSEIISSVQGSPVASKKTWKIYMNLTAAAGSEFAAMMDAEEDDLAKHSSPEIAGAIMQTRRQEVEISPGYDGVYGVPKFANTQGPIAGRPLEQESGKKINQKNIRQLAKRPAERQSRQRPAGSSGKGVLKEQKQLQDFFRMNQD